MSQVVRRDYSKLELLVKKIVSRLSCRVVRSGIRVFFTLFYRPQNKSSTVKKPQPPKGRKTRKQESSVEEDDDDDDDEDTPKRQTRRRVAAKVRYVIVSLVQSKI